MVVKDLLMQCMVDDIIKAVLKKEDENVNVDKVYMSYSSLITELKNRIPNISDYVILGIDWINFGEPMPDGVLYNINEIKTEFKINDKFERTGYHAVKSDKVNAPIIEEFPVVMECELLDFLDTEHVSGIVGKIVNVKAEEDVLSENGKVDPEKLHALMFDQFQNGYYSTGEKVATAWNAGKNLMNKN